MKPMFLPALESERRPSPYLDAVDAMRANSHEYPQIWHLFAYRPEATQHLARFTQEIMRGPSPLRPGMRELIAAFTSSRKDCPF
jgi:hypothetical protein